MIAEIELFETAQSAVTQLITRSTVLSADLERHLASLRGSGVGRTSELQATLSIEEIAELTDLLIAARDVLLCVLVQSGEG